jgi:hypothetical protein
MPYKIVPLGTGYVVKNTQTGHEFSKKGLTKLKAEAQMRLLNMIENMKRK